MNAGTVLLTDNDNNGPCPREDAGDRCWAQRAEGFLDRRSKWRFWLLLPPGAKVARAGARNFPRRRQRRHSRRGAKKPAAAGTKGIYAAARLHLIRPLRGHLPLKGKALGCAIQHRGPPRGKANGVRGVGDAAPYRGDLFPRGKADTCGGRRKNFLPWRGQAVAGASAPVNAGTVLLSDNDNNGPCPRENAGDRCWA